MADAIKIHKFEAAGLGKAPFKVVGVFTKVYKACHDAPTQPGGCCDYCGTGIMYHFQIRGSDGAEFVVGSDCVLKAGSGGEKRYVEEWIREHRREQRAELKARRTAARCVANRAKARQWLADRPEVSEALAGAKHHILRDMAQRLVQWGSLSDAQINFALRLAKEEAEKAEAPEKNWIAIPEALFEGRNEIEGVVLADKWKASEFGDVHKMLVKVSTDAGDFKLWGSVPRAIESELREGSLELRGQTVRFTARVEHGRNSDDPTFAFISRPTKAALVT